MTTAQTQVFDNNGIIPSAIDTLAESVLEGGRAYLEKLSQEVQTLEIAVVDFEEVNVGTSFADAAYSRLEVEVGEVVVQAFPNAGAFADFLKGNAIGIGLGAAAYEIATSANPLEEAAKQEVLLASGALIAEGVTAGIEAALLAAGVVAITPTMAFAAAAMGALVAGAGVYWLDKNFDNVLDDVSSYIASGLDAVDAAAQATNDLLDSAAAWLLQPATDLLQNPVVQQAIGDVLGLLKSLLPGGAFPDPAATLLLGPFLGPIQALFNRAMVDPIVLDLGGTGVQLVSQMNSNAYFDIYGTGFAVHTGWVGPQTGLLAVDRNGNGKIDDITELFGNSSTDGFTALASLDSNGDGVIDAKDAAFSTLWVWTDTNGDGVTDPGELHTLADLGITSLNLAAAETNQTVNGNVIGDVSSFTRMDDSTAFYR